MKVQILLYIYIYVKKSLNMQMFWVQVSWDLETNKNDKPQRFQAVNQLIISELGYTLPPTTVLY